VRSAVPGPNTIHWADLHHRPHFAAPRQVLTGQLVHESVVESMTAGDYTPKARLPRDVDSWNLVSLEEKKIIEEDPYASIRGVLKNLGNNERLTALQCDMLTCIPFSGRVSDA
jgi:hypothetical protein